MTVEDNVEDNNIKHTVEGNKWNGKITEDGEEYKIFVHCVYCNEKMGPVNSVKNIWPMMKHTLRHHTWYGRLLGWIQRK